MTAQQRRERAIVHVRCPMPVDERIYRLLIGLLGDITPVVQPLPPAAVTADLSGSLRYWNATSGDLAVRIGRTARARYGLHTRIGVGPTRALAAMASAQALPDRVRVIPDQHAAVTGFLTPLPVADLYGIGPVQARRLQDFGLYTIGALAALPLATAQRLLGGRPGRLAHDRARGIDPRPVTPAELPHAVAELRRFDHHELVRGGRVHRELLDAVVTVAARLRQRSQVAGSITITLDFAGRSSTLTRTVSLPEPTAHTDDLRDAAFRVLDALALERARIRAIAVRAELLTPASQAAQQFTLDEHRERRLVAEAAADRANHRFGSGSVRPARLAHRPAG